MRRKASWRILPTVVALAIFSITSQAADLIELPSVEWGCELSDERMLQGITAGLIGRGWVVTQNDGAGNLVAQVIVRGRHTLIVDIAYTNKSYQIKYKDSKDLKYKVSKDGSSATIHRNANSWMGNIQNDLTVQLNALCNLN